MARSDEAEWWFNAVYAAVQQVPRGRVTSYGHIARLLGRSERPRQVGVCLKHLPSSSANTNHHFHDANVPWQRVINAKGIISPRGPGGATTQAAFLGRGSYISEYLIPSFSVPNAELQDIFPEQKTLSTPKTCLVRPLKSNADSEVCAEGVTVGTGDLGELTVDLGAYGWFPQFLTSDGAEASESEEEEGSG